MSSDKPGGKPGRRKPEGSDARYVRVGSAGPKPRASFAVGDGQHVDNRVPPPDRSTDAGERRGSRRAASEMPRPTRQPRGLKIELWSIDLEGLRWTARVVRCGPSGSPLQNFQDG
jgi:hypothetical protein